VPGPVDEVVGTIGLTVLLSVIAHGLTARPLGRTLRPPPAATRRIPNTLSRRPSVRERIAEALLSNRLRA
jgi:NhaP-type Na+/H+ or K+/H+ antiporter